MSSIPSACRGAEQRQPQERSPIHTIPHFLALCAAPLLQGVNVELVGTLLGSDLCFMLALPFLLHQCAHRLGHWLPRAILTVLVVWLLGQIATDMIRATPAADFGRGWARIGMFGVSFTTLYLAVEGRRDRLHSFLLFSAIGLAAGTFIAPTAYAKVDPWKFGYGPAITLFAFLIAAHAKNRILGVPTPFLAAFANLIANTRSLFGVAFLASVIGALSPSSARARKLALPYVFILVAALAAAGAASVSGYSYLARSGQLGAEAKWKYDLQTTGNLGLLLSGRSESLASTKAISDSPIIGHGSWAKNRDYIIVLVTRMHAAGIEPINPFRNELIPTHSYLLGSWVEAGFAGALFWGCAFILAVYSFVAIVRTGGPDTSLHCYLMLQFIWNIWFSPFAGGERLSASAALCVAALALTSRRPSPRSYSR